MAQTVAILGKSIPGGEGAGTGEWPDRNSWVLPEVSLFSEEVSLFTALQALP